MKHFPSLLLLALFGCSADLVAPGDTIVPRSLIVSPDSTAVDTSGTLQFVTTIVWPDAAERTVSLTWSASGGEISAEGLFKAGSAPGTFHVIARCGCGVSDTAAVVVSAPSGTPGFASLTLEVSGLPSGASPQVVVTGPANFTRSVTVPATLDSLPPGAYELRASGSAVGTTGFAPDTAIRSVNLAVGATVRVGFHYRELDLPAHPRVWMNPERLTRLRAQVTAAAPRWLRLKAGADAQLNKTTLVDFGLIPDLCLAYLGTGDVRYAQRAGALLDAFAVESNDLKWDSGYSYRFSVPLTTMGLDWCYDGLTIGQRQRAATWLMNRADWVWPETNPVRASGHAVGDPGNNYFWGFMMTGPAALAAMGDDTGTGAVSGTDRPAYHRGLALAKWNVLGAPYLAGAGAGGAWTEGTNYDSSWRLGAFADGFFTAGIPLQSPFFEASLRWRLHSTMPNGIHKAPIGSQARVSDASVYTYDRLMALYMLDVARPSSDLSTQVYGWLNKIGQVPTTEWTETGMLADELLRFDPNQSAVPDFSGVPKHFLASGSGIFTYRSSWTDPDATAMVFESGPIVGAGSLNANGLMIWKGSFWVSAGANLYSHSGVEVATPSFNNLTIDGAGQIGREGNGGKIVAPPQVSDQLVVVRGQAKNSYGYQNQWVNTRPMTDYQRTVAYLPQEDVFVVVDRTTINSPTAVKVWRWHMKETPQISGKTFRLQNPAASFRCFGSVHSPADVTVGRETFSFGQTPGVSSNAVTVTLSGNASDVVVTVLQCTSGSVAPSVATATFTSNEATVSVAGRRVIVPASEIAAVRVE